VLCKLPAMAIDPIEEAAGDLIVEDGEPELRLLVN
jgi:hypothetical protein